MNMKTSTRVLIFTAFVFIIISLLSLRYHARHAALPGWSSKLIGYELSQQSHPRYAYATYLADDFDSESLVDPEDLPDPDDDGYYVSTRVAFWSLFYNPHLQPNNWTTEKPGPAKKPNIPFLVLHTPTLHPGKIDRLRKDGMITIPVDFIPPPQWMVDDTKGDIVTGGYSKVITKLRLWELYDTQKYGHVKADTGVDLSKLEKICFIDADVLITGDLHGVFEDPATEPRRTKPLAHVGKADKEQKKIDGRSESKQGQVPRRALEVTTDPSAGGMLRKREAKKSEKVSEEEEEEQEGEGNFDHQSDSKWEEESGQEEEAPLDNDPEPLPPTYILASHQDSGSQDHPIPPDKKSDPYKYMNVGFFVFKPDPKLFAYYMWLLEHGAGKYTDAFPEQNLINWAHKILKKGASDATNVEKDGARGETGRMPWRHLDWRWNMNQPTLKDYEAGAMSFHGKYWGGHGDDLRLGKIWEGQRFLMKKHWFRKDRQQRKGS